MITKNIKEIKKISYYGLTLFSTVLTLAAPAAESFSKDFVDHPDKGRIVRVPQQSEGFFGFFERGIKSLCADCDTTNDEAKRDLKPFPRNNSQQRYSELKNEVIDKYEKERPQLAQFRGVQ